MRLIIVTTIIAFLAIGAATGYSVGLSNSPVVATALPLLFGLIAGGSGFVLSGSNFEDTRTRSKLLPSLLAIAIFSISYLGAMWHGVTLRQAPQLTKLDHSAFPNKLTMDQTLALLQTRRALASYGATPEEQAGIINAFLDRLEESAIAQIDPIVSCNRLAPAVDNFLKAIASQPDKTHVDEDELANIATLAVEVSGLRGLLSVCSASPPPSSEAIKPIVDIAAKGIVAALQRDIIERGANAAFDSPWNALSAFPDGPQAFGMLFLEAHNAQYSRSALKELAQIGELNLSLEQLPLETGSRGLASTSEEDPALNELDIDPEDLDRVPG